MSADRAPICVPNYLPKILAGHFCLERLGIASRRNELGCVIEVQFSGGNEWLSLDSKLIRGIIDLIADSCVQSRKGHMIPVVLSQATCKTALQTMATDINPTREFFVAIPPKKNISAVNLFLSCFEIDCCGRLNKAGFNQASIKRYYQEGVVLLLEGLVSRTLTPGCHYDKIVVFVGSKGSGKNLGLELILPPRYINPCTFEVTPNLAFRVGCSFIGGRKAWEHNRKGSLCVVNDLSVLSDPAKGYGARHRMSRREDMYTPRYQRNLVRESRHFCFVGSTDDYEFAADSSPGDWRVYPLHIGRGSFDESVQEKLVKTLDDQWRRDIVGHVRWKLEQGYSAGGADWPDDVNSCRQFLVDQNLRG